MAKPTFINTAAQRKAGEGHQCDDLLERYVRLFASRFTWKNLPEDCPPDYLERALFFAGGISAKKVKGLGVCVMGAAPSALTIYGTPARWLPVDIVGSPTSTMVSESLWTDSNNPVLWDYEPMINRIMPYLELQRKALNALGCNLIGLTNPVIIETVPGAELNGKVIKNNLGAGDVFIPVIDKGALNANVLDLKATDHTANLTGVIHDTDNTIMDMFFIRASMEKASGISVEESTASEEQNEIGLAIELDKREKWAKEINAVLGTDFQVELTKERYYAAGPGTAADQGTERDDPRDEDGDQGSGEQD
jgi:hypothetical protein